MKNYRAPRLGKSLAGFSLLFLFLASSAWATVVTWDLNSGATGTTSQTFTSSGYSITANGYTTGVPCTPLGLYFKTSGADLPGLDIVSTSDNQLQGNGLYPTTFIRFDVSSILSQDFTDGQLQIGNVSGSDSFVIYGSSALGDPGTQIGGLYTSSSNLSFVSIANFANYKFISMGAVTGGVLPVAFQATLEAVPEMGALFPIIGLILAVSLTELLRRRRIAQSRCGCR
ncbi:MAG: hypothetical protein H0X40_01425 [Chthoniobacterales bacterium]|nr:hypothetical protein [Chthoniobacterales bacterium]